MGLAMAFDELTDRVSGGLARWVVGGLVMLVIGLLGFFGTSFNTHLTEIDRALGEHGVALSKVETKLDGVVGNEHETQSKLDALAATEAVQAAVAAALKQRMDDYDSFLKNIQPLGADRGH